MKRPLKPLAVLVFWLLVWEALALAVGRELLLPGPLTVLRRLAELIVTPAFWRTVGASLLRIVCGVVSAVVLGTVMGALCARFRWLDALCAPLLAVVKATPVASFIILALLWMGRDVLPAFIAALIVLPVIWTNVQVGVRETDRELLEAARVFRFSGVKTVTKVYAPSVHPYFLSACRSSLGMGWKAGIAAEVLTVPAVSIGRMLMDSKLYLETVDLFAWTVTVVLCSLVIEKLLVSAAARFGRKGGNDRV